MKAPSTMRKYLPCLLAVAALACNSGSASAFCVSGVCFSDFRPSSSPSTSRGSGDFSFTPPVHYGPSPEELQREKERKEQEERENRLGTARAAHARAMDCAKKGEWPCAVQQFRLALENDPGNQGVKNNLASAERLAKNEPALRSAFTERALDDMQEQARRLLAEGQPGQQNGAAYSGAGDASVVVDLRFVGERPLIVDPRKVKGKANIPPQPVVTSTEAMAPAQKERLSFLLQTRREEDIRRKGERLINPLTEPERYAEWLERQRDDAKDAVTRELTQRLLTKLTRERYQKALDAALKDFVESENQAMALGYYQAHLELQDEMIQLRKRFGMKDYSRVYRQDREGRNRSEVDKELLTDIVEQREKAKDDPQFRQAREEANDRIDAKMMREREKAHRQAVEKLLLSLKKLEKR